jgi:Transposase DDE domain group 1
MDESIIIREAVKAQFSAYASLAALGSYVRKIGLFEPIMQHVSIAQKTVRYSPGEKLLDGWIAILAGAHGLVEINKRVRPDPALQAAFGRSGCAEQSVVQDTLDACTSENVGQMAQALETIFRQHSQAYRHDYRQSYLLLEVDQTGRPCGKKAAFASKGYFAHQRNRRGRQTGYVVASQSDEVVVEELQAGQRHLSQSFPGLIEQAEQILELDEAKRQRTILRVDSGAGSVADVNWALLRGYQFHGKDYAHDRVDKLAAGVSEWIPDPHEPGRQIGWITEPTDLYCRPLRRIAVRCRKKNGQWGNGVILSSLPPEGVLALTGQPLERLDDPQAVLLAYVYFYDQRGGGVEIEIKQDKQGLGTTHRNKKRFAAQQMLVHLEALAHNVLVWARRWLAPHCPHLAHWGLLRWVRDGWRMNGVICLDASSHLVRIILCRSDPFAKELCSGLAPLLSPQQLAVTLGEI